MAPQRKNADENGSSKDKTLSSTGTGVSKSKKSAGSSLRDVTNAHAVTNGNGASADGQSGQNSETLDFNALPRRALHAYRATHNMSQPTTFRSFHNGILLSAPGSVGLHSPTMLRVKEKRRVPKTSLAKVVRNHFMDQSVNELDVEARMMYNVKTMDRALKMKFVPNNSAKK